MSEFTKGPWRIEYSQHGSIDSASVFNRHGFMCSANVIQIDETRMDGESWLDMRSRTAKARKDAEFESIANMQLISAAPDLHWVCTEIESPLRVAISMLRRGTPSQNEIADELQLKLGDLCTALAKANGQENGQEKGE